MIVPAEYPLQWPTGCKRAVARKSSRFKTSLVGAMKNVRRELDGFGRDTGRPVRRIVISTNATLSSHTPADPGVAVWFLWEDAWRCFAVDIYRTLAENMQAIALVIEADRVKIRHAGIEYFKASFKPMDVPMIAGKRYWRDVIDAGELNGSTSMETVTARYRRKCKDAAGDETKLRELNIARDEAREELEK